MILLLRKKINDNHFQNMNFIILNIIVIYEYIFIEKIQKHNYQIVIAKIISILFRLNLMNKINL